MFNLPAPGFLYAAGLSFGMVVYARWEQFQSWGSPVRSRLARLCEVLFVAYLLHVPATSLRRTLYESSERQMRTFLGWDVLQCIGYTLLLLLALAVLMPRRIWFFRSCLALTLMIAFASAWIWKMSWSEIGRAHV